MDYDYYNCNLCGCNNFNMYFNYRSARATREQVAESQRQFEEANRAFVTVNFEIVRDELAALHIQNHGKRIAKNVQIRFSEAFIKYVPIKHARTELNKLNQSNFLLGVGQSWYVMLGVHSDIVKMGEEPLSIEVRYSDRNGEYCEQTVIDFSQVFWPLVYTEPHVEIYKQLKETNKNLKTISGNLKEGLQSKREE